MKLLQHIKLVIRILEMKLYGINWIPYCTANVILICLREEKNGITNPDLEERELSSIRTSTYEKMAG